MVFDISQMFLYVISILFLLTFFFFIIRIRLGIILYLLLLLLVPKLPFFFKFSFLNLSLFFFYIIPKIKLFPLYYRPLKIFYIYFIILLLFIPFQSNCPFSFQFYTWIQFFFKTLVALSLLFVFSNQYKLDNLNILVIIIVIFVCLYSFYLIGKGVDNPWLWIFMPDEYNSFLKVYHHWLLAPDRPFGRISSVYSNPTHFGAYIVCFFFFSLFLFTTQKKLIKFLSFFCIIMLLFCSLLCGTRSCPISLCLGGGLFLFYNRTYFRFLFYICLFFICISVTFLFFSESFMEGYLFSAFDTSSSNVAGSSLMMRLNQFVGCFDVIDNNIIFGNGYNWHEYNYELYGIHPVLLGFESKLFVVICNSGILGLATWLFFLFFMHRYQTKLYRQGHDRYRILLCLFWSFQAFILFTGDYDYTFIWLIFYSLIIVNLRLYSNLNVRKKFA